MATKVKTMNLQGQDYAKVPERIKLFRSECPNGKIETSPTNMDDGTIMFTARIVKDLSKPDSAEATGHAMGSKKDPKAFEKLETVAVGRALAMLGYLASGEVASSEEMEEYIAYRQEKISEIVGNIKNFETMDELKKYFLTLGAMMAEDEIIKAKDAKKAELANAHN